MSLASDPVFAKEEFLSQNDIGTRIGDHLKGLLSIELCG